MSNTKNTTNTKLIAKNKTAYHDYFILEELECGIVLVGTEIKSVRQNQVSIQDAYCEAKDGKLSIIGMHIKKYEFGNIFNHEEKRDRILLAHKKEIRKLAQKVKLEGLTIIPLSVYFKEGLCKVNIALCKGKKSYDKRDDMKKNDAKRQIEKSKKNW